jgi:hypothetical protein
VNPHSIYLRNAKLRQRRQITQAGWEIATARFLVPKLAAVDRDREEWRFPDEVERERSRALEICNRRNEYRWSLEPGSTRAPRARERWQGLRFEMWPEHWRHETFKGAKCSILKQVNVMELSDKVRDGGQEVASATGSAVAGVLNRILNSFLGWPFKAAKGCATGLDSNKSETLGTVIYTTSDVGAPCEPVDVPADALAAVIDVCENMDMEQFRAAYQRIGRAKALAKTPAARLSGVAHTTTTLGIILAIRATLPLEKFA